jgi:acetolactate synthase-1/2/3 large subunit
LHSPAAAYRVVRKVDHAAQKLDYFCYAPKCDHLSDEVQGESAVRRRADLYAQADRRASDSTERGIPTKSNTQEGTMRKNSGSVMLVDPGELAQPERQTRAADVLVQILVDAGVDVVFGLPGGAISPMHDALVDHPQVRAITMHHEAGAVFAAAGYAHSTGKLAVVFVTSGPGVLNTMTGIASAHYDSLPVLVIAGEVPRHRFGKKALQEGSSHELDIVAAARSFTKLSAQIPDAEAAPALLRRAMATALSGRRGAVLLTLPLDIATTNIKPQLFSHEPHVELNMDGEVLAIATRVLARAKRPVIFVGAGTRLEGAPRRVRELAERLQAPVMTTPKAKGVMPEDHPLSLGVFGWGGHPSTTDYLKEGVDVLLAVGTSLGEVATSCWSPLLKATEHFIHVDIDAAQIGRTYTPTIGIAGRASQVLARMAELLPLKRRPPRRFGVRRYDDGAPLINGPEGRIAPQRALWELQRIMPPNTIFGCDMGEHMLYATHYLRIQEAFSWSFMTGLSSMASGLGAAPGIKLGNPDRPVAVVCGDGCFSMAMAEIGTAARECIPFVVCVLNDARLGMVEIGHTAIYGRTPPFAAGPMNISALAEGLGAGSVVVERAGELMKAGPVIMSFLRQTKPVVIDVRIDTSVRMPKNPRFDSLGEEAQRSKPLS